MRSLDRVVFQKARPSVLPLSVLPLSIYFDGLRAPDWNRRSMGRVESMANRRGRRRGSLVGLRDGRETERGWWDGVLLHSISQPGIEDPRDLRSRQRGQWRRWSVGGEASTHTQFVGSVSSVADRGNCGKAVMQRWQSTKEATLMTNLPIRADQKRGWRCGAGVGSGVSTVRWWMSMRGSNGPKEKERLGRWMR